MRSGFVIINIWGGKNSSGGANGGLRFCCVGGEEEGGTENFKGAPKISKGR